jgi:hypothetical protein
MGLQTISVSSGEIPTLLLFITYIMGLAQMVFQVGIPTRKLMGRWKMSMKMNDEEPWPEWNPAIPDAPEPQLPALIPDLPQHFIDLDLSSSSMRFLRASGLDISLDEVLQGSSSDDSSSSSDATLLLDENQARFLAAQSLCATVSIFHRMGLPNLSSSIVACCSPPTLTLNPILIDPEVSTPTGLELVPWKPCVPAALLQYWPVVVENLQRRVSVARESPAIQATSIIPTDSTEIIPGPSPAVVVSFSKECSNLSSVPSSNRPGLSAAIALGDITPTVQNTT